MRVFLDENMPWPLSRLLAPHEVDSVQQRGWKGKGNGELLRLVERDYDVFLTSDAGIAHQNRLLGRDVSVIVVPTNDLATLLGNAAGLRETLLVIEALRHSVLVSIGREGQRSMQRLDQLERPVELSPIAPFRR